MYIGMWGLDFGSSNLGCGALSYSFLDIVNRIRMEIEKEIKIYVFTQESFTPKKTDLNFENVEFIEFHFKKFNSIKQMIKVISECSYIFDFTAGDSFSDIYGLMRFIKTALLKSIVLNKTRLVLGPQTYGPFTTRLAKKWGGNIISKAYKVFARDTMSKEYAEKLSNREIIEVIDVAFALPYIKVNTFSYEDNKIHIGINVSGLLWNGGYTKNNQFSLKTEYKSYCEQLVSWLLNQGYIVHLLGHVLCSDFPIEDDMHACTELNKHFENCCIISPHFNEPSEAKSYISRLDCLIGARMHATIAAISSGCPVIPFAYSRKFNGLYQSLEYPYVVDGCSFDTETSLNKTKEYITNLKIVEECLFNSRELAKNKMESFYLDIQTLLLRENNETDK